MENASKALIIAGAILLSILLISMGIIVYRNASSTINSADMSETEVQTFNGKFTPYLGTNITANQVYTLCESVQTSNQAEMTNGTKRYVEVTINEDKDNGVAKATYGTTGASKTPSSTNITKLPSSQTYKVEAAYNGSIIDKITVTSNAKATTPGTK